MMLSQRLTQHKTPLEISSTSAIGFKSQLPRTGSILPQFAIGLFVALPLAALVIDLGLASLAHRQMLSATNVAALEGFRAAAVVDGDLETKSSAAETTSVLFLEQSFLSMSPSGFAGPDIQLVGGVDLGLANGFRGSSLIQLGRGQFENLELSFSDGDPTLRWNVESSVLIPPLFLASRFGLRENGVRVRANTTASVAAVVSLGNLLDDQTNERRRDQIWLDVEVWSMIYASTQNATVARSDLKVFVGEPVRHVGQLRSTNSDTVTLMPSTIYLIPVGKVTTGTEIMVLGFVACESSSDGDSVQLLPRHVVTVDGLGQYRHDRGADLSVTVNQFLDAQQAVNELDASIRNALAVVPALSR